MKKQFVIFAVIIAFILVCVLLFTQVIKPKLDNRTVAAVVPTEIMNEALSMSFTYPSGEAGYSLIEPPVPTESIDGLQKIYLLMDTPSYIKYQLAEDTETPPTVSVFVFKIPDTLPLPEDANRMTELRVWTETYSKYSSFSARTTEPEVVEIDGVQGLHYKTNGTYNQDVYLMSHRGNVYMFTGQYNSESDALYTMFIGLMGSVLFL